MAQRFEYYDIVNRILMALPPATLKRIRPDLELVDLARGQVIHHVDAPVEYLYFINRGLVSLVKTMRDGRTVEIAVVGIEGIVGSHAILGVDRTILESIVQIPGTALRVSCNILRSEIAKSEALRELLQRHLHLAFVTLAQTAACNRLHSLKERCCRWLLLAHDGARSDNFPLTHEFLAMTLGVQRAGVSIAANILRKAGLIHYTRGYVTITNRSGLEAAACECYGTICAHLDQLFSPLKQPSPR